MIEPSHALASIVRQSGLQEFADAITIAQPRACHTEVHNPARCEDLAADTARQQVLADVAAIGFALFAAALVGRITVTFVWAVRDMPAVPPRQDPGPQGRYAAHVGSQDPDQSAERSEPPNMLLR